MKSETRSSHHNAIVLFKEQKIRRVWHEEAWWFSVVDVLGALTDSKNANRYWSDLKRQLTKKEGFDELYDKIVQLKLLSTDGKKYSAGTARKETEKELGGSIVSRANYLTLPQSKKENNMKKVKRKNR